MCSHKSSASKPRTLCTTALAALIPQHDFWLHAAYGTVNSPVHLAGLVPWISRPPYLLHPSSFPTCVHLGLLLKENRAHTGTLQAGMSPQADTWPKAMAVRWTAMYPAMCIQSLCLGQKSSLREGVRTAQVEIATQACIAALILWHSLS